MPPNSSFPLPQSVRHRKSSLYLTADRMSAGKRKTESRKGLPRKNRRNVLCRRTVPFPCRSLFVIGNQVCTSPLTACQQARAKTDIRRVFIRKTPPKRIRRRTVPFPYRSLFVIGNQVCTSPLTACQQASTKRKAERASPGKTAETHFAAEQFLSLTAVCSSSEIKSVPHR